MTAPVPRRLSRDTEHRMIAGVCAGLARHYGLPTGRLRLLFVVSCLLPGPQIVAYLLLWLLMPVEPQY